MTTYYVKKEILLNRERTEARLKANAIKAEQARARARARARASAQKIQQLKAFKMPRVGDLLYHIATNRLAYCDGYSGNNILMTFPGSERPDEFSVHKFKELFKY